MIKKVYLFLFCLVLAVAFFGCGETPDGPVEAIKLDDFTIKEVANLEIGEVFDLVLDYNKEAKVNFEYDSSDVTIVSVENGKLTAIKAGTVTITITDKESNISKNITIVVNEPKQELTNEVKELFEKFVKDLPKKTTVDLPLLEGYTISYVFESSIDLEGKITRSEENVDLIGKVVLTVGEQKLEKEYKVTIIGTFIDEISKDFTEQFSKGISESMIVNKRFDDYGGTYVSWSSDNEEIFSNKGTYTQPFNDTYITISYTVKTKDPVAEADYQVKVLVYGKEIKEKNKEVEKWICDIVPENSVLYPGDTFPTYCDDYEATITWFDENGQTPNLETLAQDPILGKPVILTVRVVYPNSDKYVDFVLDYRVWNKKYNSTEEKLDDFIEAINTETIRAYEYWQQGYYEVNEGYLPFYKAENANINKEYMCEYTYGYVCTGIKQKSTEYVTVHDTAGALPTHTALSFAQNQLQKNNNKANTEYISWHFTVGTDGIYQSLPLDEVAYHAGDGSREYGTIWYSSTYDKADCIGGGNRNSIGIESCINHDADYNETMRMLAKLVAELLLDNNLSVDRVKQHYNFSGKDCPGVIRHCNRWEEFLNLVKIEYFAKTELQGVEFEWTSLTPTLLDNEGRVLVKGGTFDVSYKVVVKFEGTNKEYQKTAKVVEEEKIDLGDW